MRKKILLLGLSALIGTSTIIIPFNNEAVYANSDLEKKKEDLQTKRSGVDSSIQDKQDEISDLEKQKQRLNDEIKQFDMKMKDTTEKIGQRQGEIDETQQEIEKLKIQIEEVKQRIEKRKLLLKDRVRSLQESGGMISYLDVLLGAQDFGDLITRVSAVTTIVEADKGIIRAHEDDIKFLEQSEAELNSQLEKLEAALTELESLKKQFNSQIIEKNKLMEQVKVDQKAAEADLYELEDKAVFLKEQEAAIQKELERKKQREEQIKREEAEATARKAEKAEDARAAAAENKSSESGSTSSVLESSKPHAKESASEPVAKESPPSPVAKESSPAETGGSFMWPTKGAFTSGYGPRWGKLHAGIDIANASPDVPIVAAAEGTVIRSYYSSSYGNAVFISHNIDGKVYTTVYAHMDSRLVSSGQSVSKGQQIGFMGNTGQSTGKHLHFEIHQGAWKNPVNPMEYLQ